MSAAKLVLAALFLVLFYLAFCLGNGRPPLAPHWRQLRSQDEMELLTYPAAGDSLWDSPTWRFVIRNGRCYMIRLRMVCRSDGPVTSCADEWEGYQVPRATLAKHVDTYDAGEPEVWR